MKSAIEHLNIGAALMQKISPSIKKGVLGKEIKYGIADSEAKPNTAVQNFGKFISDNKAVLVTGSVSVTPKPLVIWRGFGSRCLALR